MSHARFIALRYAFGGRRRSAGRIISWLSISGLALGTAMLILVLAIMNGFDRELRERILVLVPHARLYTGYDIFDWQRVSAEVAAQPGVLSLVPYREDQVLVRRGGQSTAMLLFAVDPATELRQGLLQTRFGAEVFAELQQREGFYLGSALASRLGVTAGDSVSLVIPSSQGQLPRPVQVPVIGTLHTATELDHRLGLTSLATLTHLLGYEVYPTGISLHLDDPFRAQAQAMLALSSLPTDFRAQTWMSSHGNLYQAIQTSRTLVGLIVFLVLAIAAFNVLASLLISSADRQADIAILKTMGAERPLLLRVFTWQGLLVGLVGSLLGTLVGSLLCFQLDAIVALIEAWRGAPLLQSSVYPLDYLPVQLDGWQVVSVALVAVLLSTLASIYPAWRLQTIRPAETLRYE